MRSVARALTLLLALWTFATASLAADPALSVQFLVKGGLLRVDRDLTRLELGSHSSAFRSCGLTPQAVRDAAIEELDALLATRGKVIEFLAVPPEQPESAPRQVAAREALKKLSQRDETTRKLYQLDATWPAARDQFAQWFAAHAADNPPVTTGLRAFSDLYKAVVQDARLADGPLLPPPFEPSDLSVFNGQAVFTLAPPLLEPATLLRPATNPDEWERHRGELSRSLLSPFVCKPWHRDRIVGRVQDYLDLRGITAQPFRTARDATDARGLVGAEPPPPEFAGVAPERPNWDREGFGGRVLLSADPLVEGVYLELDPVRDWPLARRVWYVLLPSADFKRVMADPPAYLCSTSAQWKPAGADGARPTVMRLSLAAGPGAGLAMASTYLTRRTYAERLQRLQSQGLVATMAFPATVARRKSTNLLIERGPDSKPAQRDVAGPALPACEGQEAQQALPPVAAQPLSVTEQAGQVQAKKARASEAERRHTIGLGVEHQAGKPLRFSTSFSRTGLTGDDTVSGEIGQQRKGSAQLQYSRDFLGFGALDRRVQLSASAFSNFDPDRSALGGQADERRDGAQARAIVDLWRDRAGTFAQLELGATRSAVTLAGSNPQRTVIKTAELAGFVGGAAQGTPASQRWELGASASAGKASNPDRSFTLFKLDGSQHRFVGAFTRWDLRAHARYASADAPRTEWPAFGGEESVRGYPADAAIARRTWVVQNEYWMPLSWLAGDKEALARTLRRSVALALFADAGGLAGDGTAAAGTRWGIGAGLRLTLSDAFVLRLDYARAVGNRHGLEPGSGRFYLTVTSQRTL